MVLYEVAMLKYLQLTGLGKQTGVCVCTYVWPFHNYTGVHTYTVCYLLYSGCIPMSCVCCPITHDGVHAYTCVLAHVHLCNGCPYMSSLYLYTAPERDTYVMPNAIYNVQQILRDILMRTLDYKVRIGGLLLAYVWCALISMCCCAWNVVILCRKHRGRSHWTRCWV